MKLKIIGTVSALALLMALTAYTEANAGTSAGVQADTSITAGAKADLKEGWEDTKDAARNLSDDAKAKYEELKAKMIDESNDRRDVTYNSRLTASGMLGQPIYNTKNEKIGTFKDIILDHDGNVKLVVVSDGGFMGIGDKLAAFDASLVINQQTNGDVIMPLSEDTIKQVAEFSYDQKEVSDKIRVMPANGYSVAELLKGKLVNPKNESLGNIENITFWDGEAANVIVAFDQTAGVGGERAALDFDNLILSKADDGALNFRMNSQQSANFEAYKNTSTN